MAHGILDAIVGIAPVVRRRAVKVAVARVEIQAVEFRKALPQRGVWRRQLPGQCAGDLRDEPQPARALEGLKEMARVRGLQAAGQEVLEKGAPAGPILQSAAHAELQPGLVGEFRTKPPMSGAGGGE